MDRGAGEFNGGLDYFRDHSVVVDDDVVSVSLLHELEVGTKVTKCRSREIGCQIVGHVLGQAPGAQQTFLNDVGKDDVFQKSLVETILVPMVTPSKRFDGSWRRKLKGMGTNMSSYLCIMYLMPQNERSAEFGPVSHLCR